jgi:hypothetical protein
MDKRKKLMFSMAAVALFMIWDEDSRAQDTAAIKRTEEYAEMVATQKFLSNKVTIVIDYGQIMKLWSDNRVKTEEGKAASFNSVVDAMNYMNSQGWEFVNAFPISDGGGGGKTYHFFFRRKLK